MQQEILEGTTRLERGLIRVLRVLMILSAVSLTLLLLVTIILRYGTNSPFLAIEEVAILLALWLYFSSAAYATATQTHISGGALHLLVKSEHARKVVRFGGSVICLAVVAFSLRYAMQYGWFTYQRGRDSSYLQWPHVLWVASMLLSFAMMVLFLVLQSFRNFRTMLNDRDKP